MISRSKREVEEGEESMGAVDVAMRVKDKERNIFDEPEEGAI